jgi:hypothetical protein
MGYQHRPTDWQFRKTVFNVLTLAVLYQDIAFPLVRMMLEKYGDSNSHERRQLLNRFLEIFDYRKIDFITADREFIGADWLDYLRHEPSTRFRIRIRKHTLLDDGQRRLRADLCFQNLRVGQSKVLSKPRQIWGLWLYVAALRLDDGELLIVVTDHAPDTAITDYGKRWAIETLFGCFKTRGFCLESSYLQDPQRLSKLIALLTLPLCWAFSSGLWLAQLSRLKPKKHGRLSKSIFRLGFDFLRHLILDLHLNFDKFFLSIKFLFCT